MLFSFGRTFKVLFFFAFLFAITPSAYAELTAAGPTDPSTDFPMLSMETNDVKPALCTDPHFCPIDGTVFFSAPTISKDTSLIKIKDDLTAATLLVGATWLPLI